MSTLKTICLVVVYLALCTTVYADKFECAFLQDKYRGGKPNKASCSMLPEKVFSTKYYTPKPWEHCDIDPIYGYEDLEEVEIDTESNLVKWTWHYGLTDYGKEEQKKYYMKEEGVSKTEAERRVYIEKREENSFKVIYKHISKQKIYIDSIKNKLYNPPKLVTQYHLIIENKYNTYVIYIPESSGNAILFENTGNEESSWTNITFGKCRKVQ